MDTFTLLTHTICFVNKISMFVMRQTSRKCVIPAVCVKLGKFYVVKHNGVT